VLLHRAGEAEPPESVFGHGKPKGPKVTCLHKDDVIL
jgi:hypothetical protein